MTVPLSRPYPARPGAPTVERVDPRIFELTYFHHCMDCTFCHDSCCQYGATVEEPKVRAILARADELARYVPAPADEWFDERWRSDAEYPGGRYTRTAVQATSQGNRCVFLNAGGRGCLLHKFALENGVPVHDVKPMACNLFPVLWEDGALIVPEEIDDRTLVCIDHGHTLYRSSRNDLLFYFGPELVAELDAIERDYSRPEKAGTVSLAVV
jgi:Fe-S-cluster containining protein